MSEQFITIPKIDLASTGLEARDIVTYAYLKRHYNHETKEAFPSLSTLVEESGLDKKTIRSSIQALEKAGYITIDRSRKVNHYKFSDYKKFDIYSFDFLDNKDLPTIIKAAILLLQPEAYINSEAGIGKISYSNTELANRLGIDVKTLRKYDKLLQETDPPIMSTAITRKKDPETGLMVQERILNLEHYFNLIVCKLQQQDQAIEQNKKDIKILQNTVEVLQKKLESYEKKANAITL